MAEHENEISTPVAEAEREDSVDAFAGLGAGAVIDLVTDVFAEPLEALTTLPTDPLLSSESAPEFNTGSDTSARIDPPGAEDSELVVSDTPLKNSADQVVSGQLQATGSGFEPKAALAGVDLPTNAGGAVSLSDVGVQFDFAEANDTPGQLVDVASGSGKEMVLYPNTQTDTDTAVTYTLMGIETFNYLRSVESPESLSLDYDLPEGATLQATDDGGAIILDSDGEALVTVLAPFAVDAQGTNVPMALTVDGSSIVLDVPHRDGDFAYPIMVDPVQHVRDWWTNGSSPGFEGWSFYQDGTTQYNSSLDCPSSLASVDPCGGTGAGVYVSAVPTRTYPAGSKAYWRWVAPGGASSSITGATLNSWRYRKGNTNPGWAFYNLYNPATGVSNGATFTDGGGGSGLALTGGTSGFKYLQSGLATSTANTIPTGASNWRYNRLAGYTANLTDGEAPALSLSGAPSAWLPANTPFSVNASASDPGLGLGWINATVAGTSVNQWVGWCTGTYPYTCPNTTVNKTMNFNTNSFPSGINSVPVKAIDIVSGTGHETTQNFTVKVDKTAPTLTVGAPLNAGTPLVGAVTEVPIGFADAHSGFGQIQTKVDGVVVDTQQEVCGVSTCSTPNSVSMDLSDLAAGSHAWQVIATDKVGNSTSATGSFTLDPTAPSLSVTGPLPDSNALPLATSTANALISGADSGTGDTGIKQFEVRVDEETPIQIPVSCPSGVCPSTASDAYLYDKAVWGTGGRTVEFVAVDKAGNESMRAFTINPPPPTPVDPVCPTTSASTPSPVDVLTVNDAVDEIETEFPELIEGSDSYYDDESLETLEPSLVPPSTSPAPSSIEVTGSDAGGEIAVADTGGFVNGGAHCFMPTTTTSAATDAAIVNDDSVVYANTAPQVDTVVRPSANGVQVAQVLRGSSSQTEFEWKTELGEDDELVELSNGGLAIVDTVDEKLDVPNPTPVAASLATSSNPEAQLAVSNYNIGLAEHETEKFVKTVISPPIVQGASGQTVSLSKTGPSSFQVTTTAQTLPSVISFTTSATMYSYAQRHGRIQCDRNYACFYRATQWYGRRLQFRRIGWPTNLAYYNFGNKTSSVRNRTDQNAVKLYNHAKPDGGDRAILSGTSRCVFGFSGGIMDLKAFNEKANGILIRTTPNC
jgi:hypothetical protein